MESVKSYFEHIPGWHRSLIIAGGLFFFYMLEYIIPYVSFSYKKATHAGVNIFFTVTTAIVNLALAFLVVWSCDLVEAKRFGLLYIVHMPTWAFIPAGLLLLDLIGAWLVHYLQHKIKWMWKFHLVHHADTYVDASTANRHHPGESVFRFVFTVLAIIISGAPIWLVMLYQTLSVLISQFNHANINLPERIDKAISIVFVSPNMHKVHHHYIQPYTDSNYANIFSLWDRLFGTYKTLDKEKLVYGIDTHMQPHEHSRIKNLMSIPFQKYRAPKGSKFDGD
jgi:sterol desaturase/sphingolipid hydroxylase (fatty acid hydroxylase superfamily)